jgi:hypothetical protein
MSRGLSLLKEARNWSVLHKVGEISVDELERLGYSEDAAKIKAWLDETLRDHPITPRADENGISRLKRPLRLPEKCPYCGATIHPDLVEVIDEMTVECLYCGSVVQAEEG